jgi:hypothetical protein
VPGFLCAVRLWNVIYMGARGMAHKKGGVNDLGKLQIT